MSTLQGQHGRRNKYKPNRNSQTTKNMHYSCLYRWDPIRNNAFRRYAFGHIKTFGQKLEFRI